jgi:hypothetical protein
MVRPSPWVDAIVGKVTESDVDGGVVATVGVVVASSPQATRLRQTSARNKTNLNFKLLLLSLKLLLRKSNPPIIAYWPGGNNPGIRSQGALKQQLL